MLDDLGRPFQGAHLAHARDVVIADGDAELEVLVGVEALRVDAELGHDALLKPLPVRPSAGS
jgi:hypothetical protein